jgi:hypothetical protein
MNELAGQEEAFLALICKVMLERLSRTIEQSGFIKKLMLPAL